MDIAYQLIQDQRVLQGMQHLIGHMFEQRSKMSQSDWVGFAKNHALMHPIKELVHQCPVTLRSFQKPRGYAGDAVMLDHVYGLSVAKQAPHPSTVAGQIYFSTVQSSIGKSTRYRLRLLAEEIDKTALRLGEGNARVLSIASGHLREAEYSNAIQKHLLGEIYAFDQDEESLSLVTNEYSGLGIKPVIGSVRNLLSGKQSFSNFDLVYAAGLYDYLNEPVGKRLLEIMFDSLNPRGKLLIANFAPNITDVGYMESFMDWWLIYRDETQIQNLFNTLPQNQIAQLKIFKDPYNNIVFATAEKL